MLSFKAGVLDAVALLMAMGALSFLRAARAPAHDSTSSDFHFKIVNLSPRRHRDPNKPPTKQPKGSSVEQPWHAQTREPYGSIAGIAVVGQFCFSYFRQPTPRVPSRSIHSSIRRDSNCVIQPLGLLPRTASLRRQVHSDNHLLIRLQAAAMMT
jgi:hypothetical protein